MRKTKITDEVLLPADTEDGPHSAGSDQENFRHLQSASAGSVAICVEGELKEFLEGGQSLGMTNYFRMKPGPKVQSYRLIVDCRAEDGRFEHYEITYVADYAGNYHRITPLIPTVLS